MMHASPVRLALLLLTRLTTLAAVLWFGLWQERAGPLATRRWRRGMAIIWILGWTAMSVFEAATGSLQQRAALPLWLTLPVEMLSVAIFSAVPLLGLGLGGRLAANVSPKTKRPIAR